MCTDLLVLPFGWNESTLGLRSSTKRCLPLHTFTGEPLDSIFVRIVVCIWVFGTLQSTNDIQLLVGKLDLLLQQLVLDRSPCCWVLDVGQELVELVSLGWSEYLSTVHVVSDMGEIFIPLDRYVSYCVWVLLQGSASPILLQFLDAVGSSTYVLGTAFTPVTSFDIIVLSLETSIYKFTPDQLPVTLLSIGYTRIRSNLLVGLD